MRAHAKLLAGMPVRGVTLQAMHDGGGLAPLQPTRERCAGYMRLGLRLGA